MKMVEFTRPMLPQQAGDKRVVPDDIAEILVSEKKAKIVESPFDGCSQNDLGKEHQPRETLHLSKRRYQTR